MQARANRSLQSGQSLVEFAIASIVLILLFGGLADLSRALHFQDVLHNAVREGARHGAYFNPGYPGNQFLDDPDIKSVVDQQMTSGGLPNTSLHTPGACPAPTDGNTAGNPPYPSTAFSNVTGQPYLYICYGAPLVAAALATAPGPKGTANGADLNVILTLPYGPLTGAIPGTNFRLAANWHVMVQQ